MYFLANELSNFWRKICTTLSSTIHDSSDDVRVTQVQVDRSDYNNVIGALPYLKVNRAK